MRNLSFIAAVAGLAVVTLAPGQATASLIGDQINIASFANQAGANAVVGAGVEFDFTHANGQRDVIDVSGSTVTVSLYAGSSSWFYSGAGGGDIVTLSLLDWAGGTISDVQFVTPTLVGGFRPSICSFQIAQPPMTD